MYMRKEIDKGKETNPTHHQRDGQMTHKDHYSNHRDSVLPVASPGETEEPTLAYHQEKELQRPEAASSRVGYACYIQPCMCGTRQAQSVVAQTHGPFAWAKILQHQPFYTPESC